jgi:hypothetical protein
MLQLKIILNFFSARKMRSVTRLTLHLMAGAFALGIVLAYPARAVADDTIQEVQFRDGRFEPASLTISANAPVKLRVRNADGAPIEFESFELNRERVVAPGQVVTVFIPSLSPGTYHFFDDFHREVPPGTLIVK